MEEIERNREIISQLLLLRSIKKVVYVDEEFGTQLYQEKYTEYIRENWDKEELDLPFVYFKDAGIDATLSDFNYWWLTSNETEKLESIKALHLSIGNAFEVKTMLESLLGDTILQEYIHPDVFQANYEDGQYATTAKNQLLVFMDYDLKGVEHNGLYYLQRFKNNKYVQCGLFSRTFSIDEEITKWDSVCEKSSYIYPLSKHRVTDNEGLEFVEGLRNVLWLRQISELKKDYSKAMKRAAKNLTSFMNSIDPATFNKIVMTKSEDEGCWEFDTLHRVGTVRINREVENIFLNGGFQTFQGKLNVLRELKSKTINSIASDTQLAKELNRIDQFEDAQYINFIYSQINNGDIFKINGNNYILLCQPCNLEIRKKGTRKAGELLYIVPLTIQVASVENARNLLKVFQKEKVKLLNNSQFEELVNKTRDINFGTIIPENKDIVGTNIGSLRYDDKTYLLRYNEAVLVDAKILDLVSFNKVGKASLTIDKRSLYRYVQPNMKIRYKNITEIIKQLSPNLNDFRPFGFNGKRIADLDITRIGRLKDPWAQEYLQEFMAYLSRPAYPMDFE